MDDQQFRQLLEALKDALNRMGLTDGLGDLADNVDDANKNLTKQERLYQITSKAFDKLNREVDLGRKKIVELGPSLQSLRQHIEDMDDSYEKLNLQEKHQLMASKYLTEQYRESGKAMRKMFVGELGKAVLDTTKNLVRSLHDNGSGVAMASDLMITALDLNQNVLSGVAKTGSSLGQAMTLAGGRAGAFGAGLTVASTAVDYFSSAVTQAVKVGVNLLRDAAEKTIKAFNESTASGALFTQGMDDLRFYSSRANLTLDQFANVIKNNSALLAESGYTVTDAAKIVSNVTSRFAVQTGKSGQTLQREMLNLGLGFEEQANLTARIVADLKKTGTGETTTRGELASATVDIAKNIKTVANILGEEAKGREEAVRKQQEEYAFFVKINQRAKELNDPTLPERMRKVFTLMDTETQRVAMQAYVLDGAVTSVAGNLTGAAELVGRPLADAINRGEVSFENMSGIVGRFGDKFQSGTDEVGRALSRLYVATGQGAENAQAFTGAMQNSIRVNTENLVKGQLATEGLAGVQGGLQDQLIGVEVQAQALKIAIQNELTPAIKDFGVVANEVMSAVRKAVSKVTGKEVGGGKSFMPNTGQLIGGSMVLAGGLMSATGVGASVGVPLAMAGLQTAALSSVGEYDVGGVVEGPSSGYSATLHGTEAVVPLPDNRNIPVSLDSSSLTAAVNQNSSILVAILDQMKDSNAKASQIIQNTY
jgi:hypothetical protein